MKITIFFSWEEETNLQGFNNKRFLIACINSTIKLLRAKPEFRGVVFEFQEGLSNVSGTPRVAEIMMQRARDCDVFIGDMTIAQKLGRFTKCEIEHGRTFMRMSPNANVLMEYAIALNKREDFWHQVVLIMNTVNGDVKDDLNLFPFDIREERFPVKFEMMGEEDEKAIKDVANILEQPLTEAVRYAIKVRRDKYKPLQNWDEQENTECYSGQYIWTEELIKFKEVILSENDDIRLTGLSGYGKTRLVIESYRGKEEREVFLYGDVLTLGEKEIYEIAQRAFNEFERAIIVIDNCEPEVYKTLQKLKKASHKKPKLITIFNDPNEKTPTIALKNKQEVVVDTLFRRFRDYKSDEERVDFMTFTGGNPMIAEQVIKSMKEDNVQEWRNDAQSMGKLLGYAEKSEEREMMRALTVFTEIEYDEQAELHAHLAFIARNKDVLNIAKQDTVIINGLVSMIKTQTGRGIIERSGMTFRIRPKALNDALLDEWLDQCDKGRILRVFKAVIASPYKGQLSEGFVKVLGLPE